MIFRSFPGRLPQYPITWSIFVVAHVLSFLIFKDALTPADTRFEETLNACETIFSVNPSTDILNTLPWLKGIPPFSKHAETFAKAHTNLFAIIKNIITDRKRALKERDDEPVDFTEAMFREQNFAKVYGELTGFYLNH